MVRLIERSNNRRRGVVFRCRMDKERDKAGANMQAQEEEGGKML